MINRLDIIPKPNSWKTVSIGKGKQKRSVSVLMTNSKVYRICKSFKQPLKLAKQLP